MAKPPTNAGALVGERLGKYDILALLALGGTAEIYLARIGGAAGFEKYVVVKCLHDHLADDAEFVRMFLDEARLGAQLDHSNIVQTLELGEQNGRYFMVMEYLAGMSLALIARKAVERVPGGRLPEDLVLAVGAQTCTALHYAHELSGGGTPLNVVHRDISPQNIVISFEGIVKLVDFGIAKADVRETQTQSGTIKGKFAYMSPEQCVAGEVDRRTDIFALGTILHELLSGRRLFKRDSPYDTYQAIIDGKVPSPSQVNHQLDPALDPVIMKALAYKKEDRYPNAEAFGEALVGLLHRRGKSVSASEFARFLDLRYQKEIDEHATRMRELIEGRPSSNSFDDLQWDVPDGKSDVASQMHAELVTGRPDTDVADADGSEDQGEVTRIELNPLERIQALHESQSGSASGGSKRQESEPPTQIVQPKGRARGKTVPPPVPPGGLQSGSSGRLRSHRATDGPPTLAGKGLSSDDAPPAARAGVSARSVAKTIAGIPSGPLGKPASISAARSPATARSATDASGAVPGSVPKTAPSSAPSAAGGSGPQASGGAQGAVSGALTSSPEARTIFGAPAPDLSALSGQISSSVAGVASGQTAPPGPAAGAPAGASPGGHGGARPAVLGAVAQATAEGDSRFPPVSTPTAFKSRGELLGDHVLSPYQHYPNPAGDLAQLGYERMRQDGAGYPIWLLVAAFLISFGIGLGITVAVGG